MSNAFSGVGTTLKQLNSSSVLSTIAEVKSISGPDLSKEVIDVTSLDSTGGYREFIASFRDGGNVSLNVNFTRAGFDALKTVFDADNEEGLAQYTIEFQDGQGTAGANTQIIFNAYVVEMPVSITFDDAVMFDVTLKVTGQVTVQDAS
jgi:predicted secreted protein